MRSRILRALLVCALFVTILTIAPAANDTPQALPFTQNWSDTTLIASSDNWTTVPGIVGYRGDALVSDTGVNPQTVLADGSATPVDVIANQTNPNGLTDGGVAEFEIGNPVIALQGSGTADAPHIVISISTTGQSNIQISYNLRDIDGSADNAVQPVALQYRVGTSGLYTNVSAGFVADASTGPSLATQVTAVSVALPAAVENQPIVQIRIITTNAVGSDEWIGVDDISVTGSTVAVTTNPTGTGTAAPNSVAPGGSTLLTVTTAPGVNPTSTGLGVTADLTSIGGSATQAFVDNGTNGDLTGSDGIFSYSATVSAGTTGGSKSLAFVVSDGQARASGGSIALSVVAPAPHGVVISQIYGGGGNTNAPFTHDFIELYNRTGAVLNLSGWSVQYASATGTSWQVTPLSGSIAAGGYLLVQEATGGSNGAPLPAAEVVGGISMSSSAAKVALTNTTTALIGGCPKTTPSVADFVGYGSSANCFEGTGATATLDNMTAAIRAGGGDVDTDDNTADFSATTPVPHNSEGIPPSGIAAALPQSVPTGDTTLLTVNVTPGSHPVNTAITVTADLTAIGGTAATAFYDDGSHGDVTANDKIFSLSATVTGTSGAKSIVATIADSVPRTTNVTIGLAVETAPAAIHDIQGDGARSLYEGQFITTTGIVTAVKFNGAFIQTRDGETDASDTTSEGLFVYTGSTPAADVAVGAEVVVSGTIQEYVPAADTASLPITELVSPYFRVVTAGQPLPAAITLLPSHTAPGGGFAQLERFEGMRVAANIEAIAPTQDSFVNEETARSTSNGVFYAVVQGVARPMREAGLEPAQVLPVGAPATVPRFDGNPERLRIDSDAQTGAAKIEIAAGQTIAGLTGVLDYTFGTWTILPDPADADGDAWEPAGTAAAAPVPAASASEFTVAHFNLERFFDDHDDPAFAADKEPVLTTSALNDRLAKASLAIRDVLRTPDILGVIEVENLDVLQRLAARISADSSPATDPHYQAYLLEGNDVGSIDIGLLVKQNTVNVLGVTQIGKDALYNLPGGGTALLNDRPSLVLEAEMAGLMLSPSGGYRVTVIVNHLRSLSGIDGTDGERIRAKRRAQAEFLASYIQARQTANPAEQIISLGDYNAFGVNDGYVDVMGTIVGAPAAASQVVLASGDLVNPNLINLGDLLPAVQRYSFSFDGNAQALDHALVNAPLRRRFTRMAYARVGSDFPESFRNDPTRPERLSDHDAAVTYFAFPGAPIVTLAGGTPMHVEAFTGTFLDPGATAVDAGATPGQDTPVPVTVTGTVNVMVPDTYTLTYTATNGYFTTSVNRTVIVADTTAPAIQGFSLSPSSIWPPNHKMIDVTLTYTTSDASGAAADCTAAVNSSEAPAAKGSGHTDGDTLVFDARRVQVRSERSGETRDRVYTVTLTCGDAAGNTRTASGQVKVFKNKVK